ncbi:MAG: sensor histidine kinase [Halobacteriota archaeon]
MFDDSGRAIDGSELVALLGLVFVVSGVLLWWHEILPLTDAIYESLYELVMHVLFGGVILALGLHLERSELPRAERREVMIWCFAGFLFLFGLVIWASIESLADASVTLAFASDVVTFGSLGGAFGAIAGVNAGRAERNALLAAENEEQRETLVLLTRLLRHDIRNDMAIITGHAEVLGEHVKPEGRDSLTIIQERSNTIGRLLRDTDTLVKTLGEEREYTDIDLSSVIEEELARIRTNHPAVEVRATMPDELVVTADGLIHQLFSNLLQNAVFHNDEHDLRLEVLANRTDRETIEISVRDNGDGIDEELRETCFELGERGPGSDGDGIGLYLVSRLASVYGGTIELLDSPEGGAQFDITLPAATITEMSARPVEAVAD